MPDPQDLPYSESDKQADMQVLHGMGYAQELERRMGRFSNFAISFSIICILSGGINSLAQATSGVGGAAIGIGWPVGCLVSGVFALAMAQIASAYPTAGGLYHWGSILGNRFIGWLTAWFNLFGLVTVLGAINVGTYYFFFGAFGPSMGMEDTITLRILLIAVITALQAIVNHVGIGLTARLTDFSGTLIFVTSIALTLACLIFAPSWDVGRLFTFNNYSGVATIVADGTQTGASVWPPVSMAWAFLLGLLLPIYTITGYDASAHTAEETRDAARSVPRGMVASVIWSSLAGYIVLCSFVILLPDMDQAAAQGWNVFFWAMDTQVPSAIKTILYVAIFLSQFLCGLATVTSVSRMIFAFSRDGGLPASTSLARVNPTFRTPVAAIWTGSIASVVFVWATSLVSVGETSAYAVVVSCTVIFLFFSFAIPIAVGLFAYGTPKWPRPGPWTMGKASFRLTAVLSMAAMVLIFVLGIQPPNGAALYITVGFLAAAAIVWAAFEAKRFRGPPIGEEIARRQSIIRAAEAAVGEAK